MLKFILSDYIIRFVPKNVKLQVATNGYFSLGRRITQLQSPSLFTESNAHQFIVAPYLSDIDTRSTGSVSFEIYSNKTDLPLIQKVSNFIQQREHNKFTGTWMLIAEWKSVVDSGKKILMTLSFQLQY